MQYAPELSYTLEQFIDCKSSDPITYHNLSLLAKPITGTGIIYSTDNIIYDYLDELKAVAEKVQLGQESYMKYRFKPKLLAYDLYGTTEYYFILLAINGICSVKDFDLKRINVIEPSILATLINNIYVAEEDYIKQNRKKIEKK